MPFGVGFFAAGGGSAALTQDFELIQTINVTSNTTSVSFNSIPQTYKHLQLRAVIKNDNTAQTQMFDLRLVANNVTTSTYAAHAIFARQDVNSTSWSTGIAVWTAFNSSPTARLMTNVFGAAVIDILDYSSFNIHKTLRYHSGANGDAQQRVTVGSSLFTDTSPLYDLRVEEPNIMIPGCRFSLYGIRG